MTQVAKVEFHKHFSHWGNLNCMILASLPVTFWPSIMLTVVPRIHSLVCLEAALSQPFPLPVQLSHSREMPLEEMLHSSFNILAFSPTNIICWGNIERC